MAGGDTLLPIPNSTLLNLDGLGSGGSVTLNSTVDSKKPGKPIDNSVAGAAVRCWTPNLTKLGRRPSGEKKSLEASKVGLIWGDLETSNVPSSVSENVEGHYQERGKGGSSSSGEEALNNFLTKVVSSRKQVVSSSDPDFVVPDGLSNEEASTDSDSTPKLSLMDRIKRKSKEVKERRNTNQGSSDEESLPSPVPSNNRKQPLITDPKSRNDISSVKEPKQNKHYEDSPPSRNRKGKKKTLVIESSDSETEFDQIRKFETPGRKLTESRREPAVVISSSSSDSEGSFVNIYSPKYYDKIPPPDPEEVPNIAKPKTKSKPKVVRGSKVSPTSFKTPVRPKTVTALAVRGAPDTPTLTFLSSLTQVHGSKIWSIST